MYTGKADGVYNNNSSEDVMASKITGSIMSGQGINQMLGSSSSNGKGFFDMVGQKSKSGGGFSEMMGHKPSKKQGYKQMIQQPKTVSGNVVQNILNPTANNPKANVLMGNQRRRNPNITMDLFGNARKRMKQQQKLPMFGDFDKDKTLNVFDCDPFDPRKQAKVHELSIASRGRESKFAPPAQIIDSAGEPKPVNPPTPTIGQKIGSGVAQGFRGVTGRIKEAAAERRAKLEEGQALREQIRTEARQQAVTEIEKGKVRKAFQKDLEKEFLKSQGLARDPVTGQIVRPGPLGVTGREILGGVTAAGGAFGSGRGISEALGLPTQEEQVAPPSAPQQAIDQQLQQTQTVQPQPTAKPKKVSPFSGRLVSYTRGPYKKRQKQ
jgi:hypothetical protein